MKKLTLTIVLALVSGLNAQAGDVLRFKNETVNLQSQSVMVAKMTAQQKQAYLNYFSGHSSEYVVQFKEHIRESQKLKLTEMGLTVLGYLPDDALLVRGSGEKVLGLADQNLGVRVSVPYHRKWKVRKDVITNLNTKSVERVSIRAFSVQDQVKLNEQLSAMNNVDVKAASGKNLLVELRASSLPLVSALNGIEWIHPATDFKTMDFNVDLAQDKTIGTISQAAPTYTGYESGTKIMNMGDAWRRGYTGKGQIGAMVDTGLDTGDLKSLHADFLAVLDGYSPMCKDPALGGDLTSLLKLFGCMFLGIGWTDTNGHGTHVAGSVVGAGTKSGGKIMGGAHEASFIAQSAGVDIGIEGGMLNPFVVNDIAGAFDMAYAEGARVHTNSWGSNQNAYDNLAAQVDEFIWNNPDLTVLFAAGNSGLDENADGRIDEGSLGTPGTAKNIITVGASENLILEGGLQEPVSKLAQGKGAEMWPAEPITSDLLSDNQDGMAAFSSRGPTADGRLKPDIVAPGTNIVSTRSSKIPAGARLLWGEYDDNYLYCGGTSMATPLAAGAAVVTRQYLTEEFNLKSPSAALVKASMIHTAFDMYPGQYGTGKTQELPDPRPNIHEGYGRVDMDKLTSLHNESYVIDENAGVGTGEVDTYSLTVSTGLVATLVYTDAPGTASATKALVNDIDLIVEGPSGAVHTKADRVNNVEMIELKSAFPGKYTVKVKGINVPSGKNGKQPYAIVMTAY